MNNATNKVLIAENSPIVAKVLLHIAKQSLNFELLLATTFAEVQALLAQHQSSIFAALVDLSLPDAPNGEVVDFTLANNIPTIVLTDAIDDKHREQILAKGIVDYVAKEGRYSYQYAVNTIHRLEKNQSIKVLVVEDSSTTRKYITKLLKCHKFEIFQAVDGRDAIKVLLEHPDIRLLITDYNMPNMDGFELVKTLRSKYEKFDLVIIGLSAEGDKSLSAKFIKTGANDFLSKPFNHEEFYCRINHNIESLDLIEQIKDAANRDYISGLYNRRYFFVQSEAPYQTAKDECSPLALAIVSIDDFKEVNDHYGAEVGDKVLQAFAQMIEQALPRFLVARSSGKEFYVLMPGLSNDQAMTLIDGLRGNVADTYFLSGSENVMVSLSAGVSNHQGERISDHIATAEACLQRAKQAGKNIVMGDDE
jgi:diguanylate cyclase (GGDEF)-like protein